VEKGGSRDLHGRALGIFQGLAGSYDKVVDLATLFQDRYWKSWVVRELGVGHGSVALDIGCGTLLLEERMGGRGWTFVGLDLTEGMMRLGKAKELSNVDALLRGDAEGLPFSDGSFDAVVSCYVPKYVAVRRLAAELGRVCRPGAKAIVYDFARPKGALAPFLNLYIGGGLRLVGRLLRAGRRVEATTFTDLPGIIGRASWDEEISGAMESNGFEADEARTLTGGVVYCYCGRKRLQA